jgi:hypothetical protein
MTGFKELLRSQQGPTARKPPRTLKLEASAWAGAREDAPQTAVEIGIRRVAEEDVQAAKGEAARLASELIAGAASEDDRVSTYNDALIRVLVARCACRPDDVLEPYFALGELEIRERMTSEGVRAIWDALNALHISDSPLLPELDSEGFAHLIAMWDRGLAFDHLPPDEAAQLLRLLEHVRQAMEIAEFAAERDGKMVASG